MYESGESHGASSSGSEDGFRPTTGDKRPPSSSTMEFTVDAVDETLARTEYADEVEIEEGEVLEDGEVLEERQEVEYFDVVLERAEAFEKVNESQEYMEVEQSEEYETMVDNYQDSRWEEHGDFIDRRFQEKTNGKKKHWTLDDALRDAWLDFERNGLTTQDIKSHNFAHPLYQLYHDVREHIKYHFSTNHKVLSEVTWVKNMRNNLKEASIAHRNGVWVGKETDKRDPRSCAPTQATVLALRYVSATGAIPGAIAGYLTYLGLAQLMQIAPLGSPIGHVDFTRSSGQNHGEELRREVQMLHAKSNISNKNSELTLSYVQDLERMLEGEIWRSHETMQDYVTRNCLLRSEINDLPQNKGAAPAGEKSQSPSGRTPLPSSRPSEASRDWDAETITAGSAGGKRKYVGSERPESDKRVKKAHSA